MTRTGSAGACSRCWGSSRTKPTSSNPCRSPRCSPRRARWRGLEKKFADALAPFWPMIDGEVLPGEVPAALKAGAGAEIDTMIGTTREEMAAFYCIDKEIDAADQAQVEGVFATVFGSGHQPYYDEIRRMRASHTNAALLGDLMSDAMFRIGSLRLAEWRERARASGLCLSVRLAVTGRASNPATASRFRSCSTTSRTGRTRRCSKARIRLRPRAWPERCTTPGSRSRTRANPITHGLPAWPVYRREDRMTMRFDSVIGPVSDLAGLSWRKPWPDELTRFAVLVIASSEATVKSSAAPQRWIASLRSQ